MIVDENFDESSIDAASMLPAEPKKEPKPAISSPDEEEDRDIAFLEELDRQDIVIVNNKTFRGKILKYEVVIDKVTKQKTIKVNIRQDRSNY